MTEIIKKKPTGSGCLVWLLGLIGIDFKSTMSVSVQPQVEVRGVIEKKPVYQTAKPPYSYAHPELVPSQPQYQQQTGGTIGRAYRGQDPRGG